MDGSREPEASKDMFNTGRRSHISTSEFGLYSDHTDYYHTSNYGAAIRKIVIVIMVVVSVILIGIFLYDFASSASASSKVSQETKHIYILQNSLRKSTSGVARRVSTTLAPPIDLLNNTQPVLEDRSDDYGNIGGFEGSSEKPPLETRSQRMAVDEPEIRTQNLQNFKMRDNLMDRQPDEEDVIARQKQIIDNHAMIYRMGRLKFPEPEEQVSEEDNLQPAAPFRFEMQGPQPASFKRPKYPQLTQYRYPHASRNIQDIIKYLTSDPDTLNRGIKFTGFYLNPKKYDTGHADIGEVAYGGSEEQESAPYAVAFNADPLYRYKPKHPTDVNLLATSNFRFSPTGAQRYNPYYDPYFQRPTANKQSIYQENQYNDGSNYGKKRKPKPFSIMLDIYPITEGADQTKKSSHQKPPLAMMDEPDVRRPFVPTYLRYPKAYAQPTSIPLQGQPIQPAQEEKHQMILHLNVYPKRKSKFTRNDVIGRSELQPPDEKEQLIDRMLAPFDAIAKSFAAEQEVIGEPKEKPIFRDSREFDSVDLEPKDKPILRDGRAFEPVDVEPKEKPILRDNRGLEPVAEKLTERATTDEITTVEVTTSTSTAASENATVTTMTTTEADVDTTTVTITSTTAIKENSTTLDIDTVEGFQKFADSLVAMD